MTIVTIYKVGNTYYRNVNLAERSRKRVDITDERGMSMGRDLEPISCHAALEENGECFLLNRVI